LFQVDFGFAKFVRHNEKTNTFAGTPEYVAPEIILDRGHDRAVDYWALGILVYELLVGKTPFRGVNQIKIYQQILSGIDVIHMPSRIPKSAQHLVRHLCKQLPAERLGYQLRWDLSFLAATDARVWKITRETFRAIMQISGSREREENLQFLRSAPFLQEFDQSLLLKVVDLLQRVISQPGYR